MNTKEKIKNVKMFLLGPKNQICIDPLYPNNVFSFRSCKFFDIEFSQTYEEIDPSICVESNNVDEAILILKEYILKMNSIEIRNYIESGLCKSMVNPKDNFFILIKGNKIR